MELNRRTHSWYGSSLCYKNGSLFKTKIYKEIKKLKYSSRIFRDLWMNESDAWFFHRSWSCWNPIRSRMMTKWIRLFSLKIFLWEKWDYNFHLVFHHLSIKRRVYLYYVMMGSVKRLAVVSFLCSLLLFLYVNQEIYLKNGLLYECNFNNISPFYAI